MQIKRGVCPSDKGYTDFLKKASEEDEIEQIDFDTQQKQPKKDALKEPKDLKSNAS